MPEAGDTDSASSYFEGNTDWARHSGGCMAIGNPSTVNCSGEFRGSMEVSDPRVAGQMVADVGAGTVRIENERGTWSGVLGAHWVAGGEFIALGTSHLGAWLVGEDGYEGLNAFMNATLVSEDHGMDMQWAIEGWVFDEVPWPEAVPEA